ncbi:hypothetical protein SUGI_0479060 [Cryptomeria japonica]|nr:hypothetical protein SUGI_0479060 [Cryptomeria japonica]
MTSLDVGHEIGMDNDGMDSLGEHNASSSVIVDSNDDKIPTHEEKSEHGTPDFRVKLEVTPHRPALMEEQSSLKKDTRKSNKGTLERYEYNSSSLSWDSNIVTSHGHKSKRDSGDKKCSMVDIREWID